MAPKIHCCGVQVIPLVGFTPLREQGRTAASLGQAAWTRPNW
ncbi:hypothetical protein [Streptomyces sp. WAC 06725]|nr:hypothetical protein [Streptomyces sp. WAC 06725]